MKNLIKVISIVFIALVTFSCTKKSDECGICKSAGTDAYYTGETFYDWDKATCDDFDSRQVNGTTWSWIPGDCN